MKYKVIHLGKQIQVNFGDHVSRFEVVKGLLKEYIMFKFTKR